MRSLEQLAIELLVELGLDDEDIDDEAEPGTVVVPQGAVNDVVSLLEKVKAAGIREGMERAAALIDKKPGFDWDCCVETCSINASDIRTAAKEKPFVEAITEIRAKLAEAGVVVKPGDWDKDE